MKKGFTLIELLIVVAIIAILAAIAVPNFLEAQVRAKVTRVRADMRTIVLAVEMYQVDTNKFPTMRPPRPTPGDTSSNETLGYELTTPISYISSLEITNDIFKTSRANLPVGREKYLYRNNEFLKTIIAQPYAADLQFRFDTEGAYRLVSAGPDTYSFFVPGDSLQDQDFNNFSVINYDSSNGTVSTGDIFRTQKNPEYNRPIP